MAESFANEAETTLNGAINDSTTSITVTSAADFPSSGNYRIRIEDEFMLVTAGQGTTSWTVTREAEDASRFPAASHGDGAAVTQVLTNGGLLQGMTDRAGAAWWDSSNAPGGADDLEFTGGSELSGLTRVYNSGSPKGSWSEAEDGAIWSQTATVAAQEMDVQAFVPGGGISVGDYITLGGQYPPWIDGNSGIIIGFADGTTFGSGSQAVANIHLAAASYYRSMLNQWSGFNSRGSDGSIFDFSPGVVVVGWRVRYEAANTWGLYIRIGEFPWKALQTNFSRTMTPTHFIFGFHSISGMGFSADNGKAVRIETVRIND